MAYIPFKTGTRSFNGDNTTTVVSIAHGLGVNPSSFQVTNAEPLTQNLLGRTITSDATNIVITFSSAPITGENCTFNWIVFR